MSAHGPNGYVQDPHTTLLNSMHKKVRHQALLITPYDDFILLFSTLVKGFGQ